MPSMVTFLALSAQASVCLPLGDPELFGVHKSNLKDFGLLNLGPGLFGSYLEAEGCLKRGLGKQSLGCPQVAQQICSI